MNIEIIILSEARKRKKIIDIIYMWNLEKTIHMNLFTKQK